MEEGRFSSVSLQFPRWPIRGGYLGKIAPFLSMCVYVFLGEESKRSVDPRCASPVLFLSLSATSLSFASPLALALLLGGNHVRTHAIIYRGPFFLYAIYLFRCVDSLLGTLRLGQFLLPAIVPPAPFCSRCQL